LFISIMPLVWTWIAAVKDPVELNQDPFSWPEKWTFGNLQQAWFVGKMNLYFINSIIIAVPRVLGILTLACLAGYAFGKLKFPGQKGLFYFFLFGMMVPVQAMLIPIYFNLQRFGLINTHIAAIIPGYGIAMPFAIFMMRAFFRELPDELMEAARIDGCGNFKAFTRIMLPLTKPALGALMVFEFMWSWNDFIIPFLVLYDDTVRTLPLGLMYFRGEYETNQTLLAAAVTIASLPIIAVYLVFQRKFIEGITAGAVKG